MKSSTKPKVSKTEMARQAYMTLGFQATAQQVVEWVGKEYGEDIHTFRNNIYTLRNKLLQSKPPMLRPLPVVGEIDPLGMEAPSSPKKPSVSRNDGGSYTLPFEDVVALLEHLKGALRVTGGDHGPIQELLAGM